MSTEKLIIAGSVLGVSLGLATYLTLLERKLAAWLQDRIGPNRAGPGGILQPIADGVKLLFKEEFIPAKANKFLFILGPSLAMLLACMGGAMLPWGKGLIIGGKEISMAVADVNVGLLYMFAVVSLGAYGIMIGGWASNNKYSLMGAIRAASQIISYELAMGLAIIALVIGTGSLSLSEIAAQQTGWHWNVVYQPLGFLIFVICAFAETNRAPFDLPEAEAELVAGYNVEYASIVFALFFLAEYSNMILGATLVVFLFFINLTTIFTIVKIVFVCYMIILVRATFPRYRYNQLMTIG